MPQVSIAMSSIKSGRTTIIEKALNLGLTKCPKVTSFKCEIKDDCLVVTFNNDDQFPS